MMTLLIKAHILYMTYQTVPLFKVQYHYCTSNAKNSCFKDQFLSNHPNEHGSTVITESLEKNNAYELSIYTVLGITRTKVVPTSSPDEDVEAVNIINNLLSNRPLNDHGQKHQYIQLKQR